MFKFIKKLFGKKEVLVVAPNPKPTHCNMHKKYKKSCSSCRTIASRGNE
jgi:hypothetical protein